MCLILYIYKVKTKGARVYNTQFKSLLRTIKYSEMEYMPLLDSMDIFVFRDKIHCILIQKPMLPQHPSLTLQIALHYQHQ